MTTEYAAPQLHRLSDLRGQRAIVFGQTIQDADAVWTLGIPATATPTGPGGWHPVFGQQLKDAGVVRAAVVPNLGIAGQAHGYAVARGLQAVGLEARLVPLPENFPTLVAYCLGFTKADLLALIKATTLLAPLPVEHVSEPVKIIPPKLFTQIGEQRYTMEFQPQGVIFEVNRLRRSSQELLGELLVRVNGNFPEAKTFGDGVLQVGDMNFSSTNMRKTRADLLEKRSGDKTFDWYGGLEEFITKVIATERRGKPAEVLAEVEPEEESVESWTVEGFPILRQLPQIVFGDSASGKSYFAMWLAGRLAEDGIPVLYADWEFSKGEHKKRLDRLFQPAPKNLYYIRCEHSLKNEADHLVGVVQKHSIQLIVCDSIGFAVEGPAESQEGASGYFRYLRQLRIGSLNVAHIPKQYDDAREAQVFGSVFFKAGARSVWYIDRAKENPTGEIRFGLYHRKNNIGSLLQPKGFKLVFRGERTIVEAIDLKDVEELAAGYPLLDRIKAAVSAAPMTVKAISDELGVPQSGINATLGRYKSQFQKLGNKVSLLAPKASTNGEEF